MVETDFGDYEQIAETSQIYEAELMAGRLRAEGVDAHVVDQTFHAEPIPNVRNFAVVRVLVPKAQVEPARRILATPAPPPDFEPGTPEVM